MLNEHVAVKATTNLSDKVLAGGKGTVVSVTMILDLLTK